MAKNSTYYLSLIGLAMLAVVFSVWLQLNTSSLGIVWSVVLGAGPPALLLLACIKKTRNWSGITALCMIPYAAIGMMDIVATLGKPDAGMAVGVISILTFFLVLDAGRRTPGN